jgi:hypothetical protein
MVICDYVLPNAIDRGKSYWVLLSRQNGDQMKIGIEGFCEHCGHIDGPLKLYRDPFGKSTAPGRWPSLTMHSDCFLSYVGERRSVGMAKVSR